ncbi:unnamed protein product, partial [Eruca vesicaria subsp. sativa]|nr:unnamed protein product [Eruca vesicaria subsp. sativa]
MIMDMTKSETRWDLTEKKTRRRLAGTQPLKHQFRGRLRGSCCVQDVLKNRELRRCFGFISQ